MRDIFGTDEPNISPNPGFDIDLDLFVPNAGTTAHLCGNIVALSDVSFQQDLLSGWTEEQLRIPDDLKMSRWRRVLARKKRRTRSPDWQSLSILLHISWTEPHSVTYPVQVCKRTLPRGPQ